MTSPVDRRRFLFSVLAANTFLAGSRLLALPASHADGSGTPTHWLLIGTHDGKGIYRASWDTNTGVLGSAELVITTPRPTYLIRHPRLPVVYACNENDLPEAAVSAFALDAPAAGLTLIGSQPTHGAAPCYASTTPTGTLLFTANYSSGSLSVFPLDAGGRLAPAATVFTCPPDGPCGALGPVKDRQEAAHLHCSNLSPDHRFVLACDLGQDSILVFPLHNTPAKPLGEPFRIGARAGSGPRHLAFHPNGHWLYCVHELDCTVGLLHWDPKHPGQTAFAPDAFASILPPGQPRQGNTGAEVAITHNGRFLYASTRGANLLTVFAIDASNGHLEQLQQLPSGGKTPRFFALDPTERWLLCAGQDSDTVTTFARNPNTGALTPAHTATVPNPECLLWV